MIYTVRTLEQISDLKMSVNNCRIFQNMICWLENVCSFLSWPLAEKRTCSVEKMYLIYRKRRFLITKTDKFSVSAFSIQSYWKGAASRGAALYKKRLKEEKQEEQGRKIIHILNYLLREGAGVRFQIHNSFP